jgi:hypothetical protein
MPPARHSPMFLNLACTDCGARAGSVWVASVVSFTSRTRVGAEADAAHALRSGSRCSFFNTLLGFPG